MTFKTRLTTAIATGAVLLNALAPIAMADTVTVAGNGELSTNTVATTNTNTNTVAQTNNTTAVNTVNSSANTGGNTAFSNTGGSVLVGSGNASSSTEIANKAGVNSASLGCCQNGGTNVNITGNGEFSHNTVAATNANTNTLAQTNNTTFVNTVNNSANSGGNTAAGNTGAVLGGSTFAVLSGSATANTSIHNLAGANFASVGNGTGGTGSGNSVTIAGNGELSVNTVALTDLSATILGQTNNSTFVNSVNNAANTGGNIAFSNTGGSVLVGSGPATAATDIQNAAGFNVANVDCGCLTSGTDVLLLGNGEFSVNSVFATNLNTLLDAQANLATLVNTANTAANSGGNTASGNTGSIFGGSTTQVFGGSSTQNTSISNQGGVNSFGNGTFTFPWGQVNTTFDLSSLWAFVGLWI